MATVQFGVTLPQIKRSWEETRAAAEEFDRLGFHSVWFNDHLYGIPMPQIPIMEAWTALSAVGAITTRVELGTLVVAGRLPQSGAAREDGRDARPDHRRPRHRRPRQRLVRAGVRRLRHSTFRRCRSASQQLDEGIELMRRMWSEPQVTFDGRIFRPTTSSASRSRCAARRSSSAAAARRSCSGSSPSTPTSGTTSPSIWSSSTQKAARAAPHCEAQSAAIRQTIRISQQTMVVIGSDEADAQAKSEKAQRIYGGHMGSGIAGTPQQCIDKIRALAAARLQSGRSSSSSAATRREPARLFAEQVMPAFA